MLVRYPLETGTLTGQGLDIYQRQRLLQGEGKISTRDRDSYKLRVRYPPETRTLTRQGLDIHWRKRLLQGEGKISTRD